MLQGKGLWAYRMPELDRALEIAPRMGATHILYKVAHGSAYRTGMSQVAQRIAAAGLTPIAWMWLLLDDPRLEAQVVVRAFRDGFRGFVFDTEDAVCRNRFQRAIDLGEFVTVAGVDPYSLYNCSYPNISHHRSLPYDQMNQFCRGGLMPMSYGTFFAPGSSVPFEQQAQRVVDEWTYGDYETWCTKWGYRPPLYPILAPYHDEYGRARMGPEEFRVWLDRMVAHTPAFFSVFTAAVISENLLPLILACPLGPGEVEAAPPGLTLEVVTSGNSKLNVRPLPSTEQPPIAQVPAKSTLQSLESDANTRAKVGQDGQWLRVRAPQGVEGYVAAWYVRILEAAAATLQVEVVAPSIGFVNVRPAPSTSQAPVTQVDDGAILDALEPEQTVREKLQRTDQWLNVRTPTGVEGYVPTVHLALVGAPVTHLTVRSEQRLNVRQRPNSSSTVLWQVIDSTVLEVREDAGQVPVKVGKDQYIKVCTPSLHEGYVSGLYVRPRRLPDRRVSVRDKSLPYGESAWIFGIHAAGATTPADFRYLFDGTGKTGWVLFTEAIGADPNHGGGHDYSSWSYSGHGVIVRLNNGYNTDGTLPVRARYGDFAKGCAAYVQKSRGCHIWIIGNEQNNPREHPGGHERPIECITPQLYAEAFNQARRRIKEARSDAIVVPGAVDPYYGLAWPNGQRYRPLEYFREMLSRIDDLDGFCLHTYTHWMDPALITAATVFDDPFLQPGTPLEHYYDFRAYRPFAESIPEKWRDRPIYMTETNHWVATERPPEPGKSPKAGWVNKNRGWVRAAYEEINRWNAMPHAQQIQCLLLYRWTGDEWAIEDKREVLEDFRQALGNDYRWRR